jgi:hypothetical protein
VANFLKVSLASLAALFLSGLIVLWVVSEYSSIEYRYECSGEISDADSQPLTVFIKLAEYRWWVGLWSDSYGSMWIEVPATTLHWVEHIRKVGDQLQLYKIEYVRGGEKVMQGHFSTLSKHLSVKIPAVGFFDGTCRPIQ